MRTSVLLFFLATPKARSLFTRIGDDSALAGTSEPEDGFGPNDKMLPCNSQLVLIDLDSKASFNTHPPQFTLQHCGTSPASAAVQQWLVNDTNFEGNQIYLASPPPYLYPQTCMDKLGAKGANATIYPWICRQFDDPAHSNQWWRIDPDNKWIVSMENGAGGGLCLRAGLPGEEAILEARITLAECDVSDSNQRFVYNIDDGTIRSEQYGHCLDAGVIGRVITFKGNSWTSSRINPKACPDAGNPALLPRDLVGAYTVGLTHVNGSADLGDRLIVIGGDDGNNNIYWSDDCGTTWFCYDGEQPWSPFGRSFSPVLTLDALPGAPLIMTGGIDNSPGAPNGGLSTSLYYAFDGGSNEWGQAPYDLPAPAVFPGMISQDRDTVYVFGNASSGFAVWALDEINYREGPWRLLDGSQATVDVGRHVYIQGIVSGGCWFATDFDSGRLWAGPQPDFSIFSSNVYAVSRAATGPWDIRYDAPWAPRASAAVTRSEDASAVFIGGGMGFSAGEPNGVVYGDVWAVDAEVCLFGPAPNYAGAVCSGHGAANLDTVTCDCDDAWSGDDRCASCTPGTSYGPTCAYCPTVLGAGSCSHELGWGICDVALGCVCGLHRTGAACNLCAAGRFGKSCQQCASCSAVGGACDGSGTTSGTGACVCKPGYTGVDCSAVIPPAPAATASAALSGGAAAGLALGLIALAGFGGVGAYAYLVPGGKARVISLASNVSGRLSAAVSKLGAGGGTGERAGLLRSLPRGGLSAEQAAARFAPPTPFGAT